MYHDILIFLYAALLSNSLKRMVIIKSSFLLSLTFCEGGGHTPCFHFSDMESDALRKEEIQSWEELRTENKVIEGLVSIQLQRILNLF